MGKRGTGCNLVWGGSMKYRLAKDEKYMIGTTRKGEDFSFSIEDYPLIKQYTWSLSKRGYIVTHINRKVRPLHVILMGSMEGADIDHRSRDKLDNRRENLRFCTHQQNCFNQKKRCTNRKGFPYMKLFICFGNNYLPLDQPFSSAVQSRLDIIFTQYS